MKKQIMNLVNSQEGSFRLNKFSSLKRWTKDALNSDIDRLQIRFDSLNDICIKACPVVDITARDYDGIIEECRTATEEFFNAAIAQINNELKAGYWMGNDSWFEVHNE
jgi:hypothetical protein